MPSFALIPTLHPNPLLKKWTQSRKLDILGIIFSVDTETTTFEKPDSNDYVASIAEKYPKQFLAFCNVDP
jgi:predicted TIM-barrel fold metal-dependent hydrolase